MIDPRAAKSADLLIMAEKKMAEKKEKARPGWSDIKSALRIEQALKVVVTLPVDQRDPFMTRLREVRRISDFGYGVGEEMDYFLAEYGM